MLAALGGALLVLSFVSLLSRRAHRTPAIG